MTAELKKIIKTGIIAILAVLLILAADRCIFSNEALNGGKVITLDTEKGMTVRERVKDFNELCNQLEKNAPYIYDFEQLYGLSFNETADFYRDLVKQTDSDFEYFALNAAFLYNIPSFHMGLRLPDIDTDRFSYTANEYKGFHEASEYWKNVILDSKADYSVENFISFIYIDGRYYLIQDNSYSETELVSLNGVPVHEAVLLFPSLTKLLYDHQNGTPFREQLIFNDAVGTEYTAELKHSDGTVTTETLFVSVPAHIAFKSEGYYAASEDETVRLSPEQLKETEIISKDFYAFRNDELAYICFNDFYDAAANTIEYINTNDMPDKIILDLRDNTGGISYNALLLAEMFSLNDIELNEMIYCSDEYYTFSNDTQIVKRNELPFETRFKQLYKAPADFEDIAGRAKKQYDLTLLVSYKTGSAADNFSVYIKNNGLGKLVGAFNTGGEAHGAPHMGVLRKSGMTFYFTPYMFVNADNTVNNVYGTVPDTYVKLEREDFVLRNNMESSGENPYTFENRLKWDKVLLKAME